MRLTTFSDYALRVLMYAAVPGDRLIAIEETAKTYNVARTHLMKAVNVLTRTGYIKGVRRRTSISGRSFGRPSRISPSSNASPPATNASSPTAADSRRF
jgi:Rrf2 family nitric oxide-sensitive transcriptional repressor